MAWWASPTDIVDSRTAHRWVMQAGDGGLEIDYRFEFDRPISPGLLSSDVPVGYAPVLADEDRWVEVGLSNELCN